MNTHRLSESDFRDETVPVTTCAGITIGCAYQRPMPQLGTEAERIQRLLLDAREDDRRGETTLWWIMVLGCGAAGLLLTIWG